MGKRFETTFKEGNPLGMAMTVLTDRDTGVQYLFVQTGYAGGLTPLLNPDGKPCIAQGYISSVNADGNSMS